MVDKLFIDDSDNSAAYQYKVKKRPENDTISFHRSEEHARLFAKTLAKEYPGTFSFVEKGKLKIEATKYNTEPFAVYSYRGSDKCWLASFLTKDYAVIFVDNFIKLFPNDYTK